MNDLQKVQWDILKAVIAVCEKLDIRYFLVCGSVLGAVKYQGFIPWDDDVDIGIFREDYDRFLQEAPSHLPAHLFLQTWQTDPKYPQIFAKVRNSNTTYIEKSVAHLDIHHGIGIDVFPLDGYPSDKAQQKKLERKKMLLTRLLTCVYRGGSLKIRILGVLLRLLGIHKRTAKLLARYEAMIRAYPSGSSEIICNHGNWQGTLEYFTKEQYGDGVFAVFHGLPVRIPADYETYLTQKYGDWRSELPPEEQVGHHYYAVCDPHRSYTDYIRKCPDGSIRLTFDNA